MLLHLQSGCMQMSMFYVSTSLQPRKQHSFTSAKENTFVCKKVALHHLRSSEALGQQITR